MASVVEKSPEGEFVKCMLRMLAILQLCVDFLRALRLSPESVCVHRVKVRGVDVKANRGFKGGLLASQAVKVSTGEEAVFLHFCRSVAAKTSLRTLQQLDDEVAGGRRDDGRVDGQSFLPVDHLRENRGVR